jgi:hypothetical protein
MPYAAYSSKPVIISQAEHIGQTSNIFLSFNDVGIVHRGLEVRAVLAKGGLMMGTK